MFLLPHISIPDTAWLFPLLTFFVPSPHDSILSKVNGRSQIDVQDVAECEDLFLDARRSADVLNSESGKGFIS